MRPGANRDFWIAAWSIALILMWVGSPKAGAEIEEMAKHPGAVLTPAQGVPDLGEYTTYPELDRLASIFAMRPYEIRCPTASAWADNPLSPYVWGYTTLRWSYAVLDPLLCDAVLDVAAGSTDSASWVRAVGVSVLVHESYHGRRWHGRADEALVECKAIRHWTSAMRMLGADEISIDSLKGWALMAHWRLARLADDYYSPSCEVPNPW